MELRYKMVVSDFDDTLLADDHTVSPRNLAAIRAYVAAGGKFLLCTGRMFSSIRDWALKLGLTGYLACYQGGMVADIETGERVRCVEMSARDASCQLAELEARGMYAQLYHDDTLYVQNYDELTMEYERLCGIKAVVTGVPLSEYCAEEGLSAHKLMGIAAHPQIVSALTALAGQYPHLMYVMSKPTFLEIVPPEATKARGMRYVAEKFGIAREEIAAIGDSMNDLPMIEAAGLGVCVANGMDEVKARARLVSPYTNNEDAVARLIEEYAYGGEK